MIYSSVLYGHTYMILHMVYSEVYRAYLYYVIALAMPDLLNYMLVFFSIHLP